MSSNDNSIEDVNSYETLEQVLTELSNIEKKYKLEQNQTTD
jgi:hypothetical protein